MSPPPKTGDALVIFGITGDLARKMTFKSLYRLEERGKLEVPIAGAAHEDRTVDHLRDHARGCITDAIEDFDKAVFERLAKRLCYVGGDFADPALYERVGK